MAEYPSQGTIKPVYQGSQSTAPNASTTPMPHADPRMKSLEQLGGDRDAYRANTESALDTIMDKSRYQHPDSLSSESKGINARQQ